MPKGVLVDMYYVCRYVAIATTTATTLSTPSSPISLRLFSAPLFCSPFSALPFLFLVLCFPFSAPPFPELSSGFETAYAFQLVNIVDRCETLVH